MDTAHCDPADASHTSGLPHKAVDIQWHAPEDDEQALERNVRSLADED